MDGLLAGEDLDAMAGGSPLDMAPRKKGLRGLLARPTRPGEKENVWDSSLLLIGGGALLVLLILGLVLIWALRGGTGDQALAQAEEDYRAGNYLQAIKKYDDYLKKFPDHASVGTAWVRRGLARLRQKTGRGTSDWSTALQTAQEVIEEIKSQDEFSEAKSELAEMLLKTAEGLAAAARQGSDPQLVAKAKEALDTLDLLNLDPTQRRPESVARVNSSLDLTEHDIARDEELAKAIADMRQALAAGRPQDAYARRKRLLKDYSGLSDNAELRQAVLEVSRAQREAVAWIEKQRPPEAPRAGPVLSTVVLAQRTATANVPDVEGQVFFASAGGAVYGLEAATGKVLWRRFLGFDSNGRGIGFPPMAVARQPGADAVLVDPVHHAVLRVKAQTGEIVWRHVIGERFDAQPVIAAGRVLVATRQGRLVMIDAATGNSAGHVRLPQALHVSPAVDVRRSLVFQPADHSNLFVLGLDGGQCRQVMYLGHEPGSITAPPVVVNRYLIVGVNDRVKSSTLRVMRIDETGSQTGSETGSQAGSQTGRGISLKSVQWFRLEGHVDVAPLVSGRTVMVTTDRGAVAVYEISGTDEKKPLRRIAGLEASGEADLMRFPLMQDGRCWITDVQLTMWEIQASRGLMVAQWYQDEKCTFDHPPVAIGAAIFHVRRKPGSAGMLASAVMLSERGRYWETRLAAPLPIEPSVDAVAKKITAVSSAAALFELSAVGLGPQTVVDGPLAAVGSERLDRPLDSVVRLGGGVLAMTAAEGARQIAVFDPRREDQPFELLALTDPLACPPVAFSAGLLSPSKKGLVWLLNPRTGGKLSEPFQPPLQPGVEFAWRPPAVSAQHGVVLTDGRTKIYRLAVVDQPKPSLVAGDQADLSEPIVSPVAVLADLAYAVDAAGVLVVFRLPKLTRVEGLEQLLDGRRAWGPQRVGGRFVMLATNTQLLWLDQSGKLRRTDLPYGPLAGAPLDTGTDLVLASTGGMVWRVDAESGKETARIDVGQPLGTGPVALGTQQLLLGGHDGNLYRIRQPSPQ